MDTPSRDYRYGTRSLTVIERNIELLNAVDDGVDVIVSPDDNYLTHGGGASAAIWKGAGHALDKYLEANRPRLSLGDVWPSPPGELKLKEIYHAITLDFDANRSLSAEIARELYGRILDRAANSAAGTIGVPLLGTGAGNLDPGVSANALADALHARASVSNSLKRIYLTCMPALFKSCCRAMEKRQVDPIGPAVLKAAEGLPEKQKNDVLKIWERMADPKGENNIWSAVLLFESLIDGMTAVADQLATDAGKDNRPESIPNAKVGLGQKLNRLQSLLERIDRPMESKTRLLCADAVAARNRLAHAQGSAGIEDTLGTILDASRLLANGIVNISGSMAVARNVAIGTGIAAGAIVGALGGPLGMYIGGIAGSLIHSWKHPAGKPHGNTRTNPPKDVWSGPVQSQIGYTQPVRRLHRLLVEEMDAGLKEELIRELELQGYSGDGDLRVLEYCVRTPDLVGLLINNIGAPRLRGKLKEFGYTTYAPTTDANVLARQVLAHFGFPVMPAPRGLNSITEEIERARSRLVSMDDMEKLGGAVTQAASSLEYLLQLFIRFLCRILLDEAPELYLRRKELLKDGMQLDRCSLGTLVEILIALGKEVATADTNQAKVIRSLLSQRPILPSSSEGLPELRNKFAHFNRAKEDKDITAMRQAGKEFFAHAHKVLAYLADAEYRVFPRVIKVSSILVDEWGRRRIEAVADNGQYESLFVDEVLEPGTIYLMHPLSNPMRVDPILVPAGDLESQQGKTQGKQKEKPPRS